MSRGRPATSAGTLRCAIYTRKSSEEGLDQAFNSLHAQREACEAYILSQAGEGWTLVKTAYDDGGFSGGNIDRPALKRLLADIANRAVDVVVVYKVDRLTRSLADFAKIVEIFDASDASFVSITQAFNTTTSMGRLTLNVLLSFAQFEREVTGERIRDKIAASKAKGIWMGGMLPLGYDVHERALVVNEREAESVRSFYRRYLELKSVPALKAELDRAGVRSKRWISRRGREMGGARLTCGALCHVLQNPLYRGHTIHKGERHPGQHAPIVSADLFEAVQAQFGENRHAHHKRSTRASKSPLTKLIYDAAGSPMSPTFAYGAKGRLYRYYVSASALPGRGDPDLPAGGLRRVSAEALEAFIIERLCRLVGCNELDWARAKSLVRRVQLRSSAIEIVVNREALSFFEVDGAASVLELRGRLPDGDGIVVEGDSRGADLRVVSPVRPLFRGGRTSLSTAVPTSRRRVNPGLVRGLCNAHQALKVLSASPLEPLDRMADAVAPSDFYARRTLPLGFLAPDIQRAILQGRQPADLNMQRILDAGVPLSWEEQRRSFGFPTAGA
jgi:DNA invertase Pin-like site-specific DNA recombinase